MKKIIKYIKKNIKRKYLILFGIGLFLIIIGMLSWTLYFSKYYIFDKQENKFEKIVKEYFEYHSIYLPKDGLTKTVTLEDLFLDNRIEELYIPKTNKLCDLNSWVKVYNDNGKYIYNTYLKCGIYESKIDHEGPIITLKGDSTIYVHLNNKYEELGVEKVIDNKDGKIDVSKVTIDSSKVNTSKVGKYQVTYLASDKLNNQTKVTRTVIVAKNLTEIIKEDTNDSNYYQGLVNNNYILFSGMMYRIVNANSDGTVTLISNENLNNLRITSPIYENSNIDKYLTQEYLKIIKNQDYLVEREYCVGSITSLDDVSNSCSSKIKRKVALLSADMLVNTLENGKSYLCMEDTYTLSNTLNDTSVASYVLANSNNCITEAKVNSFPAVKPIITLKKDLIIAAGDGTYRNPYKLNDYNYAKQQDKINTRLVGEYVMYSGNIYRILNQKDGNTILIAADALKINNLDDNNVEYLTLAIPNTDDYIFNVQDQDNPGYIINNKYIDYINDTNIIKNEYYVPLNEENKLYSEYKKTKFSAKLSIPKTYDLFSSVQSTDTGYMYLYIDDSVSNDLVFNININNAKVFEDVKNRFGRYCFKPVITINGNLIIKSGKGTVTSPYYINK